MNKLNITFFDLLDNIREKYSIPYKEWAKMSGLPAPRLSELKKLSESYSFKEESVGIDRIFSVSKCIKLINGLRSVLGVQRFTEEILKALESAETVDEELLLLLSILQDDKKGEVRNLLKDIVLGNKKRHEGD